MIASPPHCVWAVLVDFQRYAEWNPLNIRAEGEPRLGARVKMRFVDAGGGKGKVIAQTVTVTEFEPNRRLEWQGRIPLLFTGRHIFELEERGGGTELRHGEDMSGLVPMTFSAERIARQAMAYERFNEALAKRTLEMVPRDGIEPPTP